MERIINGSLVITPRCFDLCGSDVRRKYLDTYEECVEEDNHHIDPADEAFEAAMHVWGMEDELIANSSWNR